MTHVFWLDRDNERIFELREDGANLALARYEAITRIQLVLRANQRVSGAPMFTLDSDALSPGLLTWAGAVGARVQVEGAALKEVGVPVGSYRARVIVHSNDQPAGIVWVDFDEYAIEVRR